MRKRYMYLTALGLAISGIPLKASHTLPLKETHHFSGLTYGQDERGWEWAPRRSVDNSRLSYPMAETEEIVGGRQKLWDLILKVLKDERKDLRSQSHENY